MTNFFRIIHFLLGSFTVPEKELTTELVSQYIKSPYDWRFVVIEGDQKRRNRGFYFGMGGTRVYRFDDNVWRQVAFKFELSPDTVVLGEIVEELPPPGVSGVAGKLAFHIIDGFLLGGKDIRGFHYTLR